MPLEIKSQEQFVTDEISAIQANLPGTFAFPLGSVVRAITEAHGRIAIWSESNIEQLLSEIRLSTSTGDAADSFVEDFGLTRLPAVEASGNVVFTSIDDSSTRLILVGATISVPSGSVSYAVLLDASNPAYDPLQMGYVLDPGTPSITLRVQASIAGLIGNAPANTITIINSPITGIDTVTNPAEFENGQPEQTDQQLRTYFVEYINSLSRATNNAIAFAVESASFETERVTQYIIVENTNYSSLTEQLGYFFVVIDDGTGTPSMGLLAAVSANVELYRGLAIRYDVYAPLTITVNFSATIVLPAGYPNTGITDAVTLYLQNYIHSVPFGGTVDYSRVGREIYDGIASTLTDQSVLNYINVNNVLVNGSTVDLTSNVKQKFIPGTINITYA